MGLCRKIQLALALTAAVLGGGATAAASERCPALAGTTPDLSGLWADPLSDILIHHDTATGRVTGWRAEGSDTDDPVVWDTGDRVLDGQFAGGALRYLQGRYHWAFSADTLAQCPAMAYSSEVILALEEGRLSAPPLQVWSLDADACRPAPDSFRPGFRPLTFDCLSQAETARRRAAALADPDSEALTPPGSTTPTPEEMLSRDPAIGPREWATLARAVERFAESLGDRPIPVAPVVTIPLTVPEREALPLLYRWLETPRPAGFDARRRQTALRIALFPFRGAVFEILMHPDTPLWRPAAAAGLLSPVAPVPGAPSLVLSPMITFLRAQMLRQIPLVFFERVPAGFVPEQPAPGPIHDVPLPRPGDDAVPVPELPVPGATPPEAAPDGGDRTPKPQGEFVPERL